MQEPFVKSNVYDLSGGLLPVPIDTGYNIVMPVYTPAGPLEKTKVVSQKDFLDRFMTSTKIQPNDHISAQFAYVTLASSPIYVMRACSASMLEGMTCEGNTWLFDSDYNLIPSYKKFDVDLDLASNQSYEISTSSQQWTESDSFKTLVDEILYSGSPATGSAAGILSATGDQIISRYPLTASNAGKWDESVKSGVFYSLSFDGNNSLGGLSYVSINGQSYEALYSLGTTPTSTLPNNHAVYTNPGNALWLGLNALAGESNTVCQLIDCKVTAPVTSITKSTDIKGISITNDNETTILANIDMPKGSIGLLADSHIKGRSRMASDWQKELEGIEVGDIYIKNVQNSNNWQYVEFTSGLIERGLGVHSSTTFSLKTNATADNEQYPDGNTLSDGEAQFSKTGKYLTVKDREGAVSYYNMTTGSIAVINKPSEGYGGISASSPSSFNEGQIGQTTVAFYNVGSPEIMVGPIANIAKSDGTFTPQDITDITAPFMQITVDGIPYTYYNTTETINPNINILIDATSEAPNVNPIFVKNAGKTVSFVVPVLGDFINLDGVHAPEPGSTIAYSGTLMLYVPTYGSAEAMGNIGLESDIEHSTPTYYYSIDANDNDAKIKFDKIQIVVGNTVYYVGENPSASSIKRLSDKPCNESEFKALLQAALMEDGISLYNGSFVKDDANLNVQAGECSSNCTMVVNSQTVTQNANETFAIVPKFPCTENLFRFSYTYDDDTKIVDLNFNYKGGVSTENWTFSFVPGVTDSYGIDQWYTRVKSDYFKVVPLNTESAPMASLTPDAFGSGIAVPAYDDQLAINAIQKLPDYEDGVQYEVISDAGICSPNLAKAINALTKQIWAVYPVSIPSYTKRESVRDYINSTEIDNFEARAWATADRIPVGTFSTEMPGSYKYVNKLIEASRSGSTEFAPLAGLNHGTVGMVNPVQEWKKADREWLLDYRVCTVKGGVTTPYYINQNYTLQKAKSYMLEEQNVRMTNAAVHVVQAMAVNYLHELNTKRLRDKVQENVNKAIQDRLFKGKAYSPAQYLAVCDDSNNTQQVIDQNQLVISLYASFTPSIHYVLIDHYIVSLDQITTNE